MKKLLRFLPSFAKMTGATFVFVVCSTMLGAFGLTSLLGMVGMSLGLIVLAFAMYALLVAGIGILFKLQQVGVLLITVCGIVGGTVAIDLIGWLVPGTVLLGGLLAAIPYAAVNTGLIWLVGWMSGSVRKDMTFLPQS
jgi:hypothetical protein